MVKKIGVIKGTITGLTQFYPFLPSGNCQWMNSSLFCLMISHGGRQYISPIPVEF